MDSVWLGTVQAENGKAGVKLGVKIIKCKIGGRDNVVLEINEQGGGGVRCPKLNFQVWEADGRRFAVFEIYVYRRRFFSVLVF